MIVSQVARVHCQAILDPVWHVGFAQREPEPYLVSVVVCVLSLLSCHGVRPSRGKGLQLGDGLLLFAVTACPK